MEATVFLLGHGKQAGQELAAGLLSLGYRTLASTWADFAPRRFSRNRPDVVIADMDKKTAQPMETLARAVRKYWGEKPAIFALTESSKFKDISVLVDAGAADCIGKNAPIALIDKKITRSLAAHTRLADELTDEVPLALLSLFGSGGHLVPLEELCSIYSGVAPRHPTWRRLAPPDPEWRGVVTAAAVDRFQAGKPDAYLRWNRLSLFRIPLPEEYAVREKVLLRRSGPPMAAAVDRSRLPAGAGVYALVPKEDVSASYIACLLNSRLLDFYFNRLATAGGDGYLRIDMLRRTPVPAPTRQSIAAMNRFAAMLEHFGSNPQSWIDRQTKCELWEEMENTIFSLYQANDHAVAMLEAMHF